MSYTDIVALYSVDTAWACDDLADAFLADLQEKDTSPLGAVYFRLVPDAFDARWA